MSKRWELTVRPEPFWLMEAFVCMNYVYVLDSEEWVNKSSSWSRGEKEKFLLPYRSYRGAMRARLQPVLEQYPLLAGYVDSASRDRENLRSTEPPMISFLTEMQYILEAEERPTEEELEETLNCAFQRMLGSDLQKSPEVREPEIHGLPDVMEALEDWEGTDADKFKLLRLYSERREVMEQLWSLKGPCTEIGRECFPLVQERFDAGMEKMEQQEEVTKLLQGVGIQCRENCRGQITPGVMNYDRIMVQMLEKPGSSDQFEWKLHLGIETFYLHQSRDEDLYNDNSLLARLKALSDLTRLKILHQLVEKPCYLQEMAGELRLTPATVLHHLGILMTEELIEIQVTKEKKRVYYRVKKQGLEEVSHGILTLAMTRKEREEQQRQLVQEEQQKQGGKQWII